MRRTTQGAAPGRAARKPAASGHLEAARDAAVQRVIETIRLAAELGAKLNTGRVRGIIQEGEQVETAIGRYLLCLERCADVAEPLGVELIVAPVNRYEVNFINNCAEGLAIVRRCGRPSVKLMPDVFHMNIEDASFRQSFSPSKNRENLSPTFT